MIYALASAATDPLEMLSREGVPPAPLSASFPWAKRPASGETRSYPSRALLTYRLPPISHTRNIANRTRECERERNCICIRGGLSRSAYKESRSSLVGRRRLAAFAAAPSGPQETARYHARV